jgi:deoxyribodipyrimidine photo-lyase
MTDSPVIVLFRRDLRLRDHPTLAAAAASGRPVIPLFVLDETEPYSFRGAARWWLHGSLSRFGQNLAHIGSPLVLRRNNTFAALSSLCRESGADLVVWTRRDIPAEVACDQRVTAALRRLGVETRDFGGGLLSDPSRMLAPSTGKPYQKFTPFFGRLRTIGPEAPPTPMVRRLKAPEIAPTSDRLEDWELTPTRPNWASDFGDLWRPGEKQAWRSARSFAEHNVRHYAERRNFPADPSGTSRLSPHLAFGEISPTELWHLFSQADGSDKLLSELAWREFCHHLFHAFPDLGQRPLQPKFADFPWRDDEEAFRRWTKGRTGYPIVDAGMRELWRTGWMHNRVRMITASFLTKDLLIDWRRGEAWFADTLLDYDPASNIANWQWVAGCGADAAPFFRIFNPITQGEKFDAEGEYVRRFVPELAALPAEHIHNPAAAPSIALETARVRLGDTYPAPVVDHADSRRRALHAFEHLSHPLANKDPDAYV